MKFKDACSLEEKNDTPSQCIEKQRHHFADKGPDSQSYGFSGSHVQMWDWTIKKAEHWRIDAFELWCWRWLLRVPWTARRSSQSILKGINPEGLMLKLKLQYLGHLMQRANSLEKTLMLGKIEGKRKGGGRRWNGWMASPTHWTRFEQRWRTGKPGMLQSTGSQRVGHDLAPKQQITDHEGRTQRGSSNCL